MPTREHWLQHIATLAFDTQIPNAEIAWHTRPVYYQLFVSELCRRGICSVAQALQTQIDTYINSPYYAKKGRH